MNQQANPAEQPEGQRRSTPVRAVFGLFRVAMKILVVAVFIALGLFLGGFLKFSSSITSLDMPKDIEAADAIVVLTGGSSRIAKALDLVEMGKGKRLLISGVNPGTAAEDIRKANDSRQSLFDCCVDLESEALNTIGNAVETKKWVERGGYKSLIVVTSGYHIPRSLLEFRRVMPTISLRAYPVPLAELQQEGWWKKPEMLRLVMSEYLKYAGAHLRGFLKPSTATALRASLWGG